MESIQNPTPKEKGETEAKTRESMESKKSENNSDQLHFFFFPYMAQGHLRPTIDMAKLFASRGQRSTVITTPSLRSEVAGVEFLTVEIPCAAVGLPDGTESIHMVRAEDKEKFMAATEMLGPQLDELLRIHRPDCLVSDMFFPWTTAAAAARGVPRLIFHGSSCFSISASLSVFLHKPQNGVSSGSEPFLIPGMPVEVSMTRDKLPDFCKHSETETKSAFAKVYEEVKKSELASHGVVVNSFHSLEPGFAECYTKTLGVKRAWLVGPVSGFDGDSGEKDEHGCMTWLDSKPPGSVVYACFGSMGCPGEAQLAEIAAGLEASGKEFLFVVPEGRMASWQPRSGRGRVVRGWAPQKRILSHVAMGGFVTHCGWNSTLEAVCAGVPMLTWPLGAEQFYNEALVTRVLGVGVAVGVGAWSRTGGGDFVGRERVEASVRRLMEEEELRKRASTLAEMARRAVGDAGESTLDLEALFRDLKSARH